MADLTISVNTQVQFTDTSTNATIFSWDFGDGNTSTLQNPTHTYTTPSPAGSPYVVNHVSANNCPSTSTCTGKTIEVTAEVVPKYKCQDGSCVRDDINGGYLTPDCNNECQQTCTPNWQVGAWGACQPDGTQSRTVTDLNNCSVDTGKPASIQACTYTPPSDSGKALAYASAAILGFMMFAKK